MLKFLNFGTLPLLSDAETRSISAENPTGEKGGRARADPPGASEMDALRKRRMPCPNVQTSFL